MVEYRLLGLYHFEEASGAHAEDSAGVITEVDPHFGIELGGTLHGATRSAGACGRGLALDGEDTNVVLNPVGDVFQRGIAAELWFRAAERQEGEAHLLGDGGGGLASFQLVLVDGFPVFRLVDQNNGFRDVATSGVAIEPGEWHHLRGRYDGDKAELLLDGVLVGGSSRIFPVEGSHNIITVGARDDLSPCCSTAYEFIGDVDEVAIWAKR
jgi:hypothetical protein